MTCGAADPSLPHGGCCCRRVRCRINRRRFCITAYGLAGDVLACCSLDRHSRWHHNRFSRAAHYLRVKKKSTDRYLTVSEKHAKTGRNNTAFAAATLRDDGLNTPLPRSSALCDRPQATSAADSSDMLSMTTAAPTPSNCSRFPGLLAYATQGTDTA